MNWRRIRRRFAVGALLGLLVFGGASWFVAEEIVAPAHRKVGPPPDGSGMESVQCKSASGSDLAAWYLPRDGARATVVLLHPIWADRRAMLSRARLLHEAGYAALLIDLQAHGESPGENITAGYRERLDVLGALAFVRARNPDHRIAIVGWSLGGAAALLASPTGVDAMVIESVYPTIQEAVHNRISMRLGAWSHILTPALMIQLQPRLGISSSKLRPIDHIGRVGCPLLIAAGDRDLHTPLSETTRLFEAAAEPKRLVLFQGADHTDLLDYDPEKYSEIVNFLNTYLTDNRKR